jgi:hypothetical protein
MRLSLKLAIVIAAIAVSAGCTRKPATQEPAPVGHRVTPVAADLVRHDIDGKERKANPTMGALEAEIILEKPRRAPRRTDTPRQGQPMRNDVER